MSASRSKFQPLTLECFSELFCKFTEGWDWEVEGFVDKNDFVYPIDTDTKVISTVFERIASPVVRSVARRFGYTVETANQTTYPDFTLTASASDGVDAHRIAIDIKTTYLSRNMKLTLGGYSSFLRNGTKNILYPYSTYGEHWIIGFLYEQNSRFREYDLDELPKRGTIPCPYKNVFMFMRRKHEIIGLRAGSGNTKNIGSIRAQCGHDFAERSGPFMNFQSVKEAADHYWRNYERLVSVISNEQDLIRHGDFRKFGPIKK